MKLFELKEFINNLPQEMDNFVVVNGEYGLLDPTDDNTMVYRVDKPVLVISVDENDEDDKDDGEEGDDRKPSDNANNSVDHFRTGLLEAMREMTKKDSLEPDEDGDIPVNFGSSCTYLSPRANPLSVDIYSVLLSEVNQSSALLAAINEANCETLFAKVKYLSEHKQIILHHEIAADSLNEGSLKRHVIHLGRMADSLDSEFKREFGGVMHGIDIREDEQDV